MINPSPYKFWEYKLSPARTDERLGLSGTDLIIFKNTNTVEIRLDDIRNDKIPIGSASQITPVFISGIPFSDIWLTHPDYKGGTIQFIVLFSGSSVQLLEELQKPKGLDRILVKMGFKL